MEFKDKLKVRLCLAIAYIVSGVAMIVAFNLAQNGNEYLSTFGLALVVVGIARWRNYRRITKNEETMKAQEIRETDERNVTIMHKAKSMTFNVFVILLCLAIIALNFMNLTVYVQVLLGILCALLLIYWVSFFIIRKRS